MKLHHKFFTICIVVVAAFAATTALSLNPPVRALRAVVSDAQTARITDRNGVPLSVTYQNKWNAYDTLPLYEMPELLKQAFLFSEDKRFFEHGGVDWRARGAALAQNVRNLRVVRGASTLTEQVVRMLNPRPRTLWSKWLEGFEAMRLEDAAGKADILEFYLNQIPYASNRRGVVQAARHYFGRDPDTLSAKEMLALAVLVRAPSGYDLYTRPARIEGPLRTLAQGMANAGIIDAATLDDIKRETLAPAPAQLPVDARHFVRHVRLSESVPSGEVLRTTLDVALQAQVQEIIDARLRSLSPRSVHAAAALVLDHVTGEVLAWVSAGGEGTADIDAVLTPRQPGSAMKPFVYALALEKGWTAATLVDDAPLADAVGTGLHRFRNYSGRYHGPVTVREALGNSLNIPALHAIRRAGTADYMNSLFALGFTSLDRRSDIYDEGLALGNGEVTLFELVGAYAALAGRGIWRPLRVSLDSAGDTGARRVYGEETASVISDILSDPAARRMEFGADSILNYPAQTAAKTGTSTDYRDAWTVAYNDRYVVGVWMGNLDYTPMNEVTGSSGPALAVRGILSILDRGRARRGLYMSPRLVRRDVCTRPAEEGGTCPLRTEWFASGAAVPDNTHLSPIVHNVSIARPTDGLRIASDPRIPAENQKFRFEIGGLAPGMRVEWTLNGATLDGGEGTHLWPVVRGDHRLAAAVTGEDGLRRELAPVEFTVK